MNTCIFKASKNNYVIQFQCGLFLSTTQTNALNGFNASGTFPIRAQHIQDICLLTPQLKIIYSKMD